jgi:tRNA U55 pseudouridine synthase TruB
MPEHTVKVDSIELTGKRAIHKDEFKTFIQNRIQSVKGDFRQSEILKLWTEYFSEYAPETLVIYKAKVACGSGFYVRQLVSDLGADLKTGAVTVSILRTRVGQYTLQDSIK